MTKPAPVDRELVECLATLGIDAERGPSPEAWPACLALISECLAQREEAALARSRRVVNALSAQAESAARVFEAFLATMSHELRTPLSVVLGSLELLAGGALLDSEERATLDVAHRSALSLTRTIDAILDYCRVEAGELGLVKRPFSLGDAVLCVMERYRPSAEERRLTLELSWDRELPARLDGDAHRLTQVLDALLSNALKFTERGWVRVAVALDREDEEGVWVRFQVSDTGVGIAPEARARLFSPFHQLDQGFSRRHGGIGLGLALTQKLVALMGGRVEVTAMLGAGSSFRFCVRFGRVQTTGRGARHAARFSGPPATLRPNSLRSLPRHRPPRVLVAEDNEFSRQFIVRGLEPLDCDVLAVTDGHAALEAMSTFEPDLVFMDVQMPEVDGLSAARRIRALPEPLSSVPIVALTANSAHGDRARCSDAGMDAFLAKPISVSELREQVQLWLGVSLGADELGSEDVTPAPPPLGRSSVIAMDTNPTDERGDAASAPVPARNEARPGVASVRASGPWLDTAPLAALARAAGALDLARLEELVEQAGSVDILRELSEIFVTDITARLEHLRRAQLAGEEESVRRLAHAIKGSAANFGALVLARLAETLERSPRIDDDDAVTELARAFEEVRAHLDAAGLAPSLVRSSRQVG